MYLAEVKQMLIAFNSPLICGQHIGESTLFVSGSPAVLVDDLIRVVAPDLGALWGLLRLAPVEKDFFTLSWF